VCVPASRIIRFICQEENGLKQEVLDVIWNSSNLHERTQEVVYKLICELLDCLPPSQIDLFYAKIMALPPSAYNNQVLTFIGDFTKGAMKALKDKKLEPKLFGLEIFWNVLLRSEGDDPKGHTSAAVLDETLEHLKRLLRMYLRSC
jgi:hypothetical protein